MQAVGPLEYLLLEIGLADGLHRGIFDRGGRGRAWTVHDHAHFAENLPGADFGEGLDSVRSVDGDLDEAVDDEERLLRLVALTKNDVSTFEMLGGHAGGEYRMPV